MYLLVFVRYLIVINEVTLLGEELLKFYFTETKQR